MVEELHGGCLRNRQVRYDFSVNVNPLGCPKEVREAMIDAMNQLEEYPEYQASSLRQRLGRTLRISANRIVVTSGASEAFLSLARIASFRIGYVISPSFYGYEYAISSTEIELHRLNSIDEIYRILDFSESIIFLANPNNPDGRMYEREELRRLVKYLIDRGAFVVLDECFLPLAGKEEESLIGRDGEETFSGRLAIVRSFTKSYAIPSIRLGYVVCDSERLASCLQRKLPEWNISGIGLAAGRAALDCIDYVARAAEYIQEERAFLEAGLRELGIDFRPSSSNYILFTGSAGLKERLLNEGILIRDCSNFPGLGRGYFRIAVKDHMANEALLDAMRKMSDE